MGRRHRRVEPKPYILAKYGNLPRNKFGRGDAVRLFQTTFGDLNSYKPKVTPAGTIAINASNPAINFYDSPTGRAAILPEDHLCISDLGWHFPRKKTTAIIGKGVCFDAGGYEYQD